jgi:serine/threonine protein kinase
VSDGPRGADEFVAGSLVAGYRLEERIGRGGMAVVYRAYDPRLDRHVALKVLTPGLAEDEAFRQRFIRESRAAAGVDDPHIIPVYEAGEDQGVLFIAMRFVRGGDVRSLLDREGPLPPRRALEIISQVSSALDAAHARGLVHRDVKPANMLLEESPDLDRPDHVYLADFGLSKASLGPAVTGLTATGQFLGTLDYVAPEQVEGRLVDGRTDLYALACAAFELLTGEPPFRRDRGVAVMYAHVSEAPPLLSSRRPGLPAAADQVLNRALAKAPGDRFPSCREFSAALRRAFGFRRGSEPQPRPALRSPTQIAAPVRPPSAGAPAGDEHSETEAAARTGAAAESGPPTPPAGPADPSGPGGPRPRPWRRSPVPIAVLCAVVVVIGAGAFLLIGRNSGNHGAVSNFRCNVPTPRLRKLSLTGPSASTGVSPFAVKESNDGRYTFTTVQNGIEVRLNQVGQAPQLVRTIPVAGSNKGLTMTPNGQYMLAANGRGAVVVDVANAESGTSPMVVGNLTSPRAKNGGGAVGVQVSPDGNYVFVTLQFTTKMAVFSLRKALAGHFGQDAFVGYVPLNVQPVGISPPSGPWLYVTSFQRKPGRSPSVGTLSVVDWKQAESNPARSVVSTVDAGCSPARVVVTGHGATVWVTARDSNTLLAFSATRLRTDPAQALLAQVSVGPGPIGLTPAGGGRLIVADSNYATSNHGKRGANGELAVVSAAAVLAGRPGVTGVIRVQGQPHQLTLSKSGSVVLVTVQSPVSPGGGTGRLQVLDISKIR